MGQFVMTFDTNNAAFAEGKGFEVARILQKVLVAVSDHREGGKIHDVNGNAVGAWSVEYPEDTTEEDVETW